MDFCLKFRINHQEKVPGKINRCVYIRGIAILIAANFFVEGLFANEGIFSTEMQHNQLATIKNQMSKLINCNSIKNKNVNQLLEDQIQFSFCQDYAAVEEFMTFEKIMFWTHTILNFSNSFE